MLKDYLEQRHISLASGRSSIALEREYWKASEGEIGQNQGLKRNTRIFGDFAIRSVNEKTIPNIFSAALHDNVFVTVFWGMD